MPKVLMQEDVIIPSLSSLITFSLPLSLSISSCIFVPRFNARIHHHPHALIPLSLLVYSSHVLMQEYTIAFTFSSLHHLFCPFHCFILIYLFSFVLSRVIMQECTLNSNLSLLSTSSTSLSLYVLSRFLMQEYTLSLTLSPSTASSIPLSLSVLLCSVPLFHARIHHHPKFLTLHRLLHSRSVERLSQQVK